MLIGVIVKGIFFSLSEARSRYGRSRRWPGTLPTLAFHRRATGRKPSRALIPLPYQGNGVVLITPENVVKMLIHDGKAVWGINYVGGLFMEALRRH
jgi:hypothetical protein